MKLLLEVLKKAIGLKFVKFKKNGIFLFGIPSYFIPANLYRDLILKFEKELGWEKTKEIFKKAGYIHAHGICQLIDAKFTFKDREKRLQFYYGRVSSIGLARVKTMRKSPGETAFVLSIESPFSLDGDFYDVYIEGLALGAYEHLYGSHFNSSIVKTSDRGFEIHIFEDASFDSVKNSAESVLKRYKMSKFISKKVVRNQNPIQLYLKKKKNFKLSATREGLSLNKVPFVLLTSSILHTLYYLSFKEFPIVTRKLFYQFGIECAKECYEMFGDNFSKVSDVFSMGSVFGISDVSTMRIRNNYAKFKLKEGSYEKVAKNIFPKEYCSSCQDFKVGFLEGIFVKKYGNSLIKKMKNSKYGLILEFSREEL